MRKNIILILPLFFLYSCGYNNDLLIKRVARLEKSVEQNRININNNATRINNIDDKLLLIEKRLETERENSDSILKAIPPSDMINKKGKTTHNTDIQKTQVLKSADNKSKAIVYSGDTKKKIQDNTFSINEIPKILSKNINKQQKISDNGTKERVNIDYKTYYKESLNYYNLRKYNEAAKRFKYFTDNFKNNSLYDNALFWLASSYFRLGNIDKSLETYKDLIKKYPHLSSDKGGKTDAALYNLVKIYRKKQDKNSYNHYKNMLIKEFPKSIYSKFVRRVK